MGGRGIAVPCDHRVVAETEAVFRRHRAGIVVAIVVGQDRSAAKLLARAASATAPSLVIAGPPVLPQPS